MTGLRKAYRVTATLYSLIVFPAILLTGWNINGQDDRQMLLLAIYTPIVASSVTVATFSVITAIENRRMDRARFRLWPPEFDHVVVLWSTTKAIFFAVLWLYGARHIPPSWVLPTALVLFAIGHMLFDDQWFGDGNREAMKLASGKRSP